MVNFLFNFQLNVLNREHAIYFENTVPSRERTAFICTNIEDMNLFIKLQQNVDVLYSNPNMKISNYQPKIPIENLSKYGFEMYMNSMYEAPEVIMTYLCENYNLHNIPVAFGDVALDQVPQSINLYFASKFTSIILNGFGSLMIYLSLKL